MTNHPDVPFLTSPISFRNTLETDYRIFNFGVSMETTPITIEIVACQLLPPFLNISLGRDFTMDYIRSKMSESTL